MGKRKQYPSNVSRAQFELVRPVLEGARKRTKPRTLDFTKYSMGCCTCSRAAASGVCSPKDFPSGPQCIRTSPGGATPARTASASWSGLYKKSVGEVRAKQGRNVMTSFLIVDAEREDSAEQKGYDAGKEGVRHQTAHRVDTQGLPHAIALTPRLAGKVPKAVEELRTQSQYHLAVRSPRFPEYIGIFPSLHSQINQVARLVVSLPQPSHGTDGGIRQSGRSFRPCRSDAPERVDARGIGTSDLLTRTAFSAHGRDAGLPRRGWAAT